MDSSLLDSLVYMQCAYRIKGVRRNYLSSGWALGCASMPIFNVHLRLFYVYLSYMAMKDKATKQAHYTRQAVQEQLEPIAQQHGLGFDEQNLILVETDGRTTAIPYTDIVRIVWEREYIRILLRKGCLYTFFRDGNKRAFIDLHTEDLSTLPDRDIIPDTIGENISRELEAILKKYDSDAND